jgi:putative proteasome-type protease
MTYCVAMCLADGLVFASDSRTNAGVDHIATFKKLHVFAEDGERVMVLQSAGNLATTQSVISLLSTRIATQQEPNLMQVSSLYDAAMLIGKTLQEVIQRDSSNQQHCGNTNFNCNLLLGGQIAGKRIAFSISTRKAILLKPRTIPLISRLARANTASRLSTGCSAGRHRWSRRCAAR